MDVLELHSYKKIIMTAHQLGETNILSQTSRNLCQYLGLPTKFVHNDIIYFLPFSSVPVFDEIYIQNYNCDIFWYCIVNQSEGIDPNCKPNCGYDQKNCPILKSAKTKNYSLLKIIEIKY